MLIEEGKYLREWLDVSNVKEYNSHIFDEIDKSYINDLEGMISIDESILDL